jgi:PPM family protein phosphatase
MDAPAEAGSRAEVESRHPGRGAGFAAIAAGIRGALPAGMKLDVKALTITGRRAANEDAVCARPDLGLFVVADGMGGYEGGEIASLLAVETIEELVRRTAAPSDVFWPPGAVDVRRGPIENEVAVATRAANERIVARRRGALAQMGSTVAVLRLDPTAGAVTGHVGDSRIYRLRAGTLAQLTIDHSLYAQLVAEGHDPGADFAWHNVVTRALGTPHGEPDVATRDLLPNDVYLVCSDGLSGVLSDATLTRLLSLPTATLACTALVDAAYAAGSKDNISAIVVRVL